MVRLAFLCLAIAGCAVGPADRVPSPATAGGVTPPPLDALDRLVHDEANAARQRAGREPVRWSGRLARAARAHGEDMARRRYFGHVSPEGATPTQRAAAQGTVCRTPVGEAEVRDGVLENLYRTTRYARVTDRRLGPTRTRTVEWFTDASIARAAVRGWLGSAGHRQNLLDRHARSEGVGVAVGPDSLVYVVQLLC